jgi:hypothetical protein
MKIFRILITAILMASASFAAQAQNRALIKANIPFAFTVENVELPAGNYTISSLAPDSLIMVQSADGRHAAIVHMQESAKLQDAKQTMMVFRHLGNEFFLSQVWQQGSGVYREVRTGKRATQLAKNGSTPQLVTVVASPRNGSHS